MLFIDLLLYIVCDNKSYLQFFSESIINFKKHKKSSQFESFYYYLILDNNYLIHFSTSEFKNLLYIFISIVFTFKPILSEILSNKV